MKSIGEKKCNITDYVISVSSVQQSNKEHAQANTVILIVIVMIAGNA